MTFPFGTSQNPSAAPHPHLPMAKEVAIYVLDIGSLEECVLFYRL